MFKTLATNKQAFFDYEILDKHEAGLKLSGQEVKSIRNGGINLKSAYITFHNEEAFLTNARISPYKFASNLKNYDPLKSRRLLLKKKEIAYLRGKLQEKGLTIIPISLYTKGNLLKVEIALCKGKKTFDKRASIKKREIDREIARKMKNGDDRVR